ncbi:pentatricopeptide repeat-containing protein [Hordeum vulgare]|nr:pentatricopeptide repeat-containing protein [Hordeum vulgare]
MEESGLQPDEVLVSCVLSGLGNSGNVRRGKAFHAAIIKRNFGDSLLVANALISMYGKLELVDDAGKVFGVLHQRDAESWNLMVVLYCKAGLDVKCLELCREMHCRDRDEFANALIGMYGRCGKFDLAYKIFGVAKMLTEGVQPNSSTLITVISACANLAALEHGELIHSHVKDMGLEYDVSISTSLVDMYSKCGQLGIARGILDSMLVRDVVTWNVMMSGYGMHGDVKQALQLFNEMEGGSIKPNSVTFLAILSACCHAGYVDEGRKLFIRMGEYYLEPNLKHYACMVDLLGKSGHLQEAEDMILAMPIQPDGGVWGTLLSACKMHDNFKMGLRVAKKAFASDPGNDGYYILMSNSYGSAEKWDEIEKLRDTMKNHGVEKGVGFEMERIVEINDNVHPKDLEMPGTVTTKYIMSSVDETVLIIPRMTEQSPVSADDASHGEIANDASHGEIADDASHGEIAG